MSEIKPVAWFFLSGHGNGFHLGEQNPRPDFMWRDGPAWKPLYDADAIESLQAGVERLREELAAALAEYHKKVPA